MITKLLAMSGVARAGPPARAGAITRARAGALYFPAANIRYVPRLHAPLECRWRIDPMTGALSACWLDPSANTRAVAAAEQEPAMPDDGSRDPARPRAAIPPRGLRNPDLQRENRIHPLHRYKCVRGGAIVGHGAAARRGRAWRSKTRPLSRPNLFEV